MSLVINTSLVVSGPCYNPYLFFSVRITQWWGSSRVELTQSFGYVTNWIHMPWWGPITVEITPSWDHVTTHIYFFVLQWVQDRVLLQLSRPHNGVVLQPVFTCRDGHLLQLIYITLSWGPVTTRIYLSQFEKETHPTRVLKTFTVFDNFSPNKHSDNRITILCNFICKAPW